jgi:hypothetical protein
MSLDALDELINEFAVQGEFTMGPVQGSCRLWWGGQDQVRRKLDGARLSFARRDLLVVREDLPRDPQDGDTFRIDGQSWTVRPREEQCFSPADRLGNLLRVYVTK